MYRNYNSGGKNTNLNGLSFEKRCNDKINCIKIINNLHGKINNKKFNCKLVEYNGETKNNRKYFYCEKNNFKKLLFFLNIINKDIYEMDFLYGLKAPDSIYIDKENKRIFIIEQKFQQSGGSVCEKIQTGKFKKDFLSNIIKNYEIIYIYQLSYYFKKLTSELKMLNYYNIPYFFGEESSPSIINYIFNYN